jgi:DNA-binding beta-propeller fold protein YncE
VCALAVACLAGGCGFGQSGISPPVDRFFFPAGATVDPAGGWLYVVNSNSDLRFNAGTVVGIDLSKARTDRSARWDRCPYSGFLPPPGTAAPFCCRDFVDDGIVNCDERRYIDPASTVRIGSFGGTVVAQSLGGTRRRVFVAVRAEPSVTFIDADAAAGQLKMSCNDPGQAKADELCGDPWRITQGHQAGDGTPLVFQEEPHEMLLDDAEGLIYISHLGDPITGAIRGLSMIDVCSPTTRAPTLASALPNVFPRSGATGVTGMTQGKPGDPTQPLYVTAERTPDIGMLVFFEPDRVACGPDRDLRIALSQRFASTVFNSRGADLRGMVFSSDGSRAYVLHRQFAGPSFEFNPPSVELIDRSPDQFGQPQNRPIGFVEVCSGPTKMAWHDAGRGQRLFINCFEGGQVYVVDPDLLAIEGIIDVGAGPADFEFSRVDPSTAYVTVFANNNVAVVDLQPGSNTEFRVVQRIGFPRPATTAP